MIVMDPTWSGSTSQLHFTVWYITWYPSIGVATRVWVRRVCCQPTWPTPASSSAASYSLSGSSATSSSSSSSPHQSPWGEYKVVVYFQNTSGMATYFLSANDNRDNINKNCNNATCDSFWSYDIVALSQTLSQSPSCEYKYIYCT